MTYREQGSDYLVFVDESGDHNLGPNYRDYPLFVLAFCIIHKKHYANFIAPKFLELKLKYFQDTHVIFHEEDIRKQKKDFKILTNTEIRETFFSDLNNFIIE